MASGDLPRRFRGKVTAISDGDTFRVLYAGTENIVRLEHIDCPEKKQPFGNRAKQFASALCFGRIVTVTSSGKRDRNKRLIAEVFVGDTCVNKEMIKRGLAWHYKQYSESTNYARLELVARKQKVGIWSLNNYTEPWKWRQQQREKR